MTPTQKKRLITVSTILIGTGMAIFFAVKAFQENIEYFKTPSDINNANFEFGQTYRIAGLVEEGSVSKLEDGVTHRFKVTDCITSITIQYTGILPDLFRVNQAIVSVGKINQDKLLIASQVLAKHDENYVPNEAADAMMLAQASQCDGAESPISY